MYAYIEDTLLYLPHDSLLICMHAQGRVPRHGNRRPTATTSTPLSPTPIRAHSLFASCRVFLSTSCAHSSNRPDSFPSLVRQTELPDYALPHALRRMKKVSTSVHVKALLISTSRRHTIVASDSAVMLSCTAVIVPESCDCSASDSSVR